MLSLRIVTFGLVWSVGSIGGVVVQDNQKEELLYCLQAHPHCPQETGSEDIHEQLPEECGIGRDSNFDHIDGVRISLNSVAIKI
jgi:hypothetical protein